MINSLGASKTKEQLSLAPHEWASIYKLLEPVLKNGGLSIRHLEGCVLVILDEIDNRLKDK